MVLTSSKYYWAVLFRCTSQQHTPVGPIINLRCNSMRIYIVLANEGHFDNTHEKHRTLTLNLGLFIPHKFHTIQKPKNSDGVIDWHVKSCVR